MAERRTSQQGESIYSGTVIAVAPMMDWTDRHCRYFHRQLSRHALLYTEMVVADAILHGDLDRVLGFDTSEHPLALQIGGNEPDKLARAAAIGAAHGYDEINLNVGCPSDRVQSGTFGACLMLVPGLVGACVAAMRAAVSVPVTVKCRIGVDDQDPEVALRAMAEAVFANGADALWVHARKAWLQGLSPKENREIPPLDYDIVYRLKQEYPDRFIGLNGGVTTLAEAAAHLDAVDGVMFGRAAYHTPAMLAGIDPMLAGGEEPDLREVIEAMARYADRHVARGGRLLQVTRHMVGLFHGRPGARAFRRMLSEEGARRDASAALLREAARLVLEAEPA